MAKKYIQQQRANIAATRRIMAQSRNMGYKAVNNILDSISGNLTTATGRNTAALLGGQASQLQSLKTLAARSRAQGSRITQHTTESVANRYGSAIAGGTDFSGVRAQQRANAVNQRGITSAAGLLAQGNEAAAATQASGVQQAESAAEYAASQAKLYRAKNDAGLIAQAQLELQKTRLEAKLDLENYRKKLKMDDKKNGSTTGAESIGNFGADSATSLLDIFNHVYTDGQNFYTADQIEGIHSGAPTTADGTAVKQVNAMQASTYYAQEYGLTDAQKPMLQAMAATLYQHGAGKAEGDFQRDPAYVTETITNQLALLYPDLTEKQLDNVSGLVMANFKYNSVDESKIPRGKRDGDGGEDDPNDEGIWDHFREYFTGGSFLFGPLGPIVYAVREAKEDSTGGAADFVKKTAQNYALIGGTQAAVAAGGIATGAFDVAGGALNSALSSILSRGGTTAVEAAKEIVATGRISATESVSRIAQMVKAARMGGPGSAAWKALEEFVARVGTSGQAIAP